MALSILDGNQSATTLSTILSSGQHITAHTVVSLGTQAITDMRGAVSGSVVSISNFPATQPVSIASVTVGNSVTIGSAGFAKTTGAVSMPTQAVLLGFGYDSNQNFFGVNDDAPLPVQIYNALPAGTNRIGVVTIGAGTVTIGAGTAQIGSVTASISNFPATQPISISSVTIGNSVTIGAILDSSNQNIIQQGGGVRSVLRVRDNSGTYGDLQGSGVNVFNVPVYGTVTIGAGTAQIGSVTVGNSVTIGSLPAISGTVTANAGGDFAQSIENVNDVGNASKKIAVQLYDDNGSAVGVPSNPIPISGTVDVGTLPSWGLYDSGNDSLKVSINDVGGSSIGVSVPISGTVTANLGSALPAGTAQIGSVTASISNSVTIASLPSISGTVTANSSNGSLTTRFGSVTTANTAFATSAVTNANRKYLLIQNVTTASNVITVGVGFTPTTTQGIQLTAGAGLTFEGSYIPTGAVNLLSSVTASCFTILEA